MFYSSELLSRKSPLGAVWLLAHGRKLTRPRIMAVDVGATVDAILDPEIPHALRLQAVLVVGVSTVHARQAAFLLDDARATLKSVMLAAGGGDAQTLPEGGDGGAPKKGAVAAAAATATALGATGDLTHALLLAAGAGGGLGDDLLAELEAGPLALFGRFGRGRDAADNDDFLVAGDASTLIDGSLPGFAGAADALAAAARGRRGAGAPTPRADIDNDVVLPDADLAALAVGGGDDAALYAGGEPMAMFDDGGFGGMDGGVEVAAPRAALAPRKAHPARMDRDGTTLPSATFREWMTNAAPVVVPGGRPARAAAAPTDDALRARLAVPALPAGEYGDALAALFAARTAAVGGGPAPPPKKRARKAKPAAAADGAPPASPAAAFAADGGGGVHDYGFGEFGLDGGMGDVGGGGDVYGAAPSPAVARLLEGADDGIERLRKAFLGSQPHLRTSPGSSAGAAGANDKAASSGQRPSSDDDSRSDVADRDRAAPRGRGRLPPLPEAGDGTQFPPTAGDGSLLVETQPPRTQMAPDTSAATRAAVSALEARFAALAAAGRPVRLSTLAAADAAGGRLHAARLFYQVLACATGGYVTATQAEPYGDVMLAPGPRMAAVA